MIDTLLLAMALVGGDASAAAPDAALDAAVSVPDLVDQADRSYLVQRWDRAIEKFEQVVAANPTVGYYWYRLGMCRLMAGQFEGAIEPFTKANELGAFQWHPLRTVYHGEATLGLAAAHARLGHRDEAIRWTRTSLAQGLRDIRQFHGKHFESLLNDDEFKQLVWAQDVKGLSRDEGLRHDLRFVMHEAKRIHYAPFRQTSEAELDSMAAALEADIPKLDDDQAFVRLMAIMRRLGDGHTHVHRQGKKPNWLGVQLGQYPEGIYVECAAPDRADLVGAKILKIGDCTIEEALRRTEEITSRDNPMNVQSIAPRFLTARPLLRGLGIAPGDGPVPVEIEDATGRTRQVELAVMTKRTEEKDLARKVPGCEAPLPLCQKARTKMYWFETLPDEKLVFCQINGIGNDPNEAFDKFCKRLFEAVEKPEIDGLVIDIRYNGGGNTFVNVPLIEGIIRSDKLQQPGKLFVIIGRATFSAAQNTTSELERRTKAILVGEPTGSNPNFIGESIAIPLPSSGWVISLSDLWWQHSMSMDYRVWTNPQLYAPPTAEALRAQRDPAMEVIARYRARSAAASSQGSAGH